MSQAIQNRYEFVYLFDCADGNPNGDPDAANAPRLDPQTMQGLVSDVCIKRKIRNYIYLSQAKMEGGRAVPGPGYDLHVRQGTVLNDNIRLACEGTGINAGKTKAEEKELAKKRTPGEIGQLQAWLCERFFDIRAFGSVLSTGPNAGQLRGPVQISFARSLDPVLSLDFSITRVCGTEEQKATEMGRKMAIAYGLYRCHGYISAHLAGQTGFSEADLGHLFRALCGRGGEEGAFLPSMMDQDVSAARRLVPRLLIAFRHDSMLGNAPAHQLFERVQVARKASAAVPRSFSDYQVHVEEAGMPAGVRVLHLLKPEAAAGMGA